MKKLISAIIFITFFITTTGFAQTNVSPVKWKTSVKKISDCEYELTATADIDSDWHIYASEFPSEGPIPTSFFFDTDEKYSKEGEIVECEKGQVVHDKIFDGQVKYFNNKATFTQKIKLKTNLKNVKITGVVEYMACSKSVCLPPKESNLAFVVNGRP